ncbi:MAG: AraC family transcriptional regulator [Kiritimatiellia bacterium]|nr:AraC family transcriptional regulator [Kiritimatiellia bacterium]
MAKREKTSQSFAEASPCGCASESHEFQRPATELWGVRFQTAQPMEAFPQLHVIIAERQTDPTYHYKGSLRSSERSCLFKLTLAGEGRFQVGRKKYCLPAGHGFLCEINDPATSYYYPEDGRGPWEFVYLSFIGPTATAMTREFVRRHGPVFHLPPDSGIISEITAWRRYDKHEVRITPAEGARIIAGLFAALSQSKVSLNQSDAGFVLVQETRRLVRKYLHQFCNVKFLSAQLGVSREHLSRVFKEQTAQTPYQYVQRQKMLEACRLLKETRLTQKEITARMGYNVPAHFTRAFTRIMRLTPRRFRAVGVIPTQ